MIDIFFMFSIFSSLSVFLSHSSFKLLHCVVSLHVRLYLNDAFATYAPITLPAYCIHGQYLSVAS